MVIEYIKSILLGIVEGITEWLPISSTGHMILFNEFTNTKNGFLTSDVFLYVIQLGAILAIVTLFFKKLNPFSPSKTKEEKANTWQMWFKVVIACLPAAGLSALLLPKRRSALLAAVSAPVFFAVCVLFEDIYLFDAAALRLANPVAQDMQTMGAALSALLWPLPGISGRALRILRERS